MGFIEDKIKEIEVEKTDFLNEIEGRIARLKKEGHIGHPNHMHFTVGGDIKYKILMIFVLNTRGLKIKYEGKKLNSKFTCDCSQKAYNELVVYTLDELVPIVYDKYQEIVDKFWDSVYEKFKEKKIECITI